jgi:hypothetical protein
MAHAGIVVAFCDDRTIKMAVRGAVMGGIIFVASDQRIFPTFDH